MRKFLAVILVLLILAGTISINAFAAHDNVQADVEELEDITYLSFGKVDGLELVYISSQRSEESCTCVIGDFCFTADSSFTGFGVISGGKFTPLSEAYGSVIGDERLAVFVEMFTVGKTGTEIESWEVISLSTAEDETAETASTDPPETMTESAAAGETDPEGNVTTPQSPTEPWENQTATETCTGQATQPTGYTINPPTEPNEDEHPTGVHIETKPTENYNTGPAETEETIITTESDKTITEKSAKLSVKTATVKCGRIIVLSVSNKGKKKVTYTSANPSVAKVGKTSGRVCAMKKGSTYIIAKVGSKKLKFTIKVVTSPKLSKTSVKVRKGKTVKVKIVGKCPLIKNKYASTKYAKILSKKTANTVKVRGLKKGKTTLKIKVNGYLLKLKVKVN